jgi:hypothetical protein
MASRLVRIHHVDRKDTVVRADKTIIYIDIGKNLPEGRLRDFIGWIDGIIRADLQGPFNGTVEMNRQGANFTVTIGEESLISYEHKW